MSKFKSILLISLSLTLGAWSVASAQQQPTDEGINRIQSVIELLDQKSKHDACPTPSDNLQDNGNSNDFRPPAPVDTPKFNREKIVPLPAANDRSNTNGGTSLNFGDMPPLEALQPNPPDQSSPQTMSAAANGQSFSVAPHAGYSPAPTRWLRRQWTQRACSELANTTMKRVF